MCRPTIINAYKEDLPDVSTWFDTPLALMFGTEVVVYTSKGTERVRVCNMLKPIKHSKCVVPLTPFHVPTRTWVAILVFNSFVHAVRELAIHC